MSTLRKDLFVEYGAKGLETANREFRKEYTPKKEGRFNYNDITYEYGPLEFDGKIFQFEISSKIPQDKIREKIGLEEYFDAIKEEISLADKKPVTTARENIIRGAGAEDRKERDYVKARYCYLEEELFTHRELQEKLEAISKNQNIADIPKIPGIVTVAGRLILSYIQAGTYQKAREAMKILIAANEKVLRKLE